MYNDYRKDKKPMKNRLTAFYTPDKTQVSKCLLKVWNGRKSWPVQASKSLDSLITDVQSYQEGFLKGSCA